MIEAESDTIAMDAAEMKVAAKTNSEESSAKEDDRNVETNPPAGRQTLEAELATARQQIEMLELELFQTSKMAELYQQYARAVDTTADYVQHLEQTLEQERSSLENIFESLPIGTLVTDEDGIIRRCNQAAVSMLGWARAHLVAGRAWEILTVPPAEAAAIDRSWKRPDGNTRQLELSLKPMGNSETGGDPHDDQSSNSQVDQQVDQRGWVVNIQDVTELRKLQEDAARRHRYVAMGEMAASVAHEIRNPLASIGLFAELIQRELLAHRPGPPQQSLVPSLAPAEPRGGETKGTSAVRERIERGDEGSSAAPLASSTQAPSTQALTPWDGRECLRHVDHIAAAVSSVNHIISNLLTYTKPRAVKQHPLALDRLLRQSIDFLGVIATKHDVRVDLHLTPPAADDLPPRVQGDSEQLKQVFHNLFLNAVQAMPDGGRLRIAMRQRALSDLHLRTRFQEYRAQFAQRGQSLPRRILTISFQDEGPGIPRELQKQVFDPFFTRKDQGTGLGLAIVHSILEAHRATIDVESSEGQGTTMVLSFPLFQASGG